MKKICTLLMLLILSGLMINCGQAPPAPNAFRLKTRIKFRLFGFIPLFGVPLPFQRINLKTNTMPGAPGTIGTRSEFDVGGNFIPTDVVGKFDAVAAVLPATWVVKADPNQILRFPCQYQAMETFQAVAGKTYKYRCNLDVINSFVATPSYLQTNQYGVPPIGSGGGSWATVFKGFQGKALFTNAQSLQANYYRFTGVVDADGEEEYELEDVENLSGSSDGTSATVPGPSWQRTGYLRGGTTKVYRIVLVENGVYIGHTEFDVYLPEHNCSPRTRVC